MDQSTDPTSIVTCSLDEQKRFLRHISPLRMRHGQMGGDSAAGVRLEYDSNMRIAQLVSSLPLVLQSHRFWVKFSKHKGPILSPKQPKLLKNVILLYPLIIEALQNLYASTY